MAYPSCPFTTLLRLASPTDIQWVCEPETEALINWVMVNPDMARGGEAWLVAAADFTPERLAYVQAQGIVAIVLVGLPAHPEQYSTAGLPIACLPAEMDFQDAFRLLVTILVNQRAHLMEWGSKLQAQLSRLEAEGAGLASLVETMSSMSGKAVLVQDKRLEVLASSVPQGLQGAWETLLGGLKELDSLPEGIRDRKEAAKQSILIVQKLSDGFERLVAPINVGKYARGYISLIGIQGELDDLDRVVAEEGREVIAMEMSRSKAVREAEKRLKGEWLTALLQGELSPRDARLWTQDMGLDLSQAHACLRFSWDAPQHPSFRYLETLVNGEVARGEYVVLVDQFEEEVVCFIQVPPGTARPDAALNLGRSVLDKAALTLQDSQPRCGIGTPAQDLTQWNDTFRQAGQALEMARRLSERRPLYYPDLSVYRLLMQMEHSPEAREFYKHILGPLLAYESGDELIRTLEAYFERNGNLKKTANVLYIHRNTLLYRLERIKEITGLDLDDPETRLALQLTLRIRKMFGGS